MQLRYGPLPTAALAPLALALVAVEGWGPRQQLEWGAMGGRQGRAAAEGHLYTAQAA